MLATTFKTLSEFISFLAQSFRLAAIVPAFIFLMLNQLFVLPLLPPTIFIADFIALTLNEKLALITFGAFLLGYTINILNIPLIRLFEGYPWYNTWYGQRLIKRKLLQKNILRKELTKHILAEIAKEGTNITSENSIRYELLKHFLDERFPYEDIYILPTSLGNVIAAFEDYPLRRYNIDTITIWPRLVPILSSKHYTSFIEREKAALDFMVNISFLFIVSSIEIICVSLLYAPILYPSLVIAVLLLLFAVICYRIAIIAAGSWGMTIKVAFDLYRYSLLEALNIDPLQIKDAEKNIWIAVSKFFQKGDHEEWFNFSKLIDYSKLKGKVE